MLGVAPHISAANGLRHLLGSVTGMLVRTLVLLIAVCALLETRRQERQIITRFIERGKQQVPDSFETAKEDETSLRGALHGSKIALWIITALTAIDLIHSLFFT